MSKRESLDDAMCYGEGGGLTCKGDLGAIRWQQQHRHSPPIYLHVSRRRSANCEIAKLRMSDLSGLPGGVGSMWAAA